MLRDATAGLNLLLGAVYLVIGAMIVLDLRRGWRTLGFSHFGVAFAALAFTCGPHHLMHGIHTGFEGRPAGPLDMVAALVGVPAGLIWFSLRLEAFRGGRGDRHIAGTPFWIVTLPMLAGAYATVLIAATMSGGHNLDPGQAGVYPNVLLVVVYPVIGYYLLRTQVHNHRDVGGWSLSGLCLTLVFFTCSLMHLMFIYYSAIGTYAYDVHGLVVDWLSVPAGIYFLWAVQGLYRARLHDWSVEPAEAPEPRPLRTGAPAPA